MKAPNDGGPAFPAISETNYTPPLGMSLREYYAGQVLAGILASPNMQLSNVPMSVVARDCFLMADAMLAERQKGKTK